MGQKKLVRKAEPPSKRGIAWPRWTGFRGMTVRDWLQLLIVPLALVVIGFLFTTQQDQRQQRTENQRAEAERELAERRADDEALQAYLDQMSGLLLERDLRASEEDSEVRTLARARTLTVLSRLDPSRKTALMQFLVEADLVQRVDGRDPIISLRRADLSGAILSSADLTGADLRLANLSNANLTDADLSDAYLRNAKLIDAKLLGTKLRNADLWHTKLSDAYLRFANLTGADLRFAILIDANLREANLIDANLSPAGLSGADLSDAYLSNADLSNAELGDANLSNAYLSNADLRGANLTLAVLSSAEGIKNEELEHQAETLEGATMPNGQKYEDWLKDKEAQGKDEKNE